MEPSKNQAPYRRILMEKVRCPECGKLMTIRNLQHRHNLMTLGLPPEQLECMRAKATGTAIEAHATRMTKLRGPTATE